ncbi:segregation/condensation protein A [Streptomyces cinereoruber]|uniref:segregation and condensation protein A n=1 Tax=Streptomyces cinereoruber TaxID=67260 RepID=UPI0036324723
MHHAPDSAPDETSRPPRRRTLGRGGGAGPPRGAGTGAEAPGNPEASPGASEAPSGTFGAAVLAPAPDREPPEPVAEPSAPAEEPAADREPPAFLTEPSASVEPGPDEEHPDPAEEPGPAKAVTVLPGGPDAAPPVAGEPGAAGGSPTGGEHPAAVPEPAEEPPAAGPAGSDGRFTVRLSNFEGPFDLLLQLITKHKLDVTEVALSRVTDEFMAHLRALGPDGDLDQTTEFLVVAATLLDLKTARLLPAAEVEDEADLALLEARDLLFARLLQYRAYKRVAAIFEERWESEGRRHPRTVGLEPHHAELLPEVILSIGAEGLAKLAVKAMRPRAEPQVYVEHIHAPLVSVREQAAVVAALLRERGTAPFRELIEDAGDTLTVVARFLALLELYRERAVALDQETALGDLTVSWTGGDGETRVTDEFDQEPGQEQKTEARA